MKRDTNKSFSSGRVMSYTAAIVLLIIVLILFLITIGLSVGYYIGTNKSLVNNTQVESIVQSQPGSNEELSDWQILIMALAKTESEFNPLAEGKTKDLGLLQLTPIYIKEANRILGEERYCHEDAKDPLKSIEMFNIVQNKRNPTHNIDKAIRIHNPGGDAIGYSKRVKNNIKYIKSSESVRTSLFISN